MKLKFLSQGRLRHSPWDEQDERKMLELAKKRTPIADVYEAFKPRTEKAVNAKIVRMFLSRNNDVLQVSR